MAAEDSCKTKYPLLLVHGVGGKDFKKPLYWGRIPGVLEARGAVICYGFQDSWGSIATNAKALAERIAAICRETGCGKVNIIAHSKGGLDARMAISSFGAWERTASLTTMATPHHGSKTIERILQMPQPLWNIAALAVNNWCRILGDKKPDFIRACREFSAGSMEQFNRCNPDMPGVFYQSYGCIMRHPLSDINLSTANFILSRIEGPNDGLVSEESSRWGEHHVLRGNGFRGVSHVDAVDARRLPLSDKPGEGVSDICDVYVKIVEDLKNRGL